MTDKTKPVDCRGLYGDRAIFFSNNGELFTQKELQFINRVMAKATLSDDGQDIKTEIWHKISRALGGENDY